MLLGSGHNVLFYRLRAKNKNDIWSIQLDKEGAAPTELIKDGVPCSIWDYRLHPTLDSIITFSKSCEVCRWDQSGNSYNLVKKASFKSFLVPGNSHNHSCEIERLFIE